MAADNLGFTFQIIVVAVVHGSVRQFAEAVAEGRGKAQAATLRQTREETKAKLIVDEKTGLIVPLRPASLRPDRSCLVEAGDSHPSDGEVIEGVASVNEAAITGESAPSSARRAAIARGHRRHAGGLRLAQGAHHAAQGSTFLDRMIALVEGAERQKTPNEIALNILLAGMTIIFVFATRPSQLRDVCRRRDLRRRVGGAVRDLIPTTIGALSIGHRHCRHGPARALQRARHVWPRRRGGR
jgi:K+-transporting ATPase ATPase B chain